MTVRVLSSAADLATASILPRLSTTAAKRFVHADEAVLILVRGDCPHCAAYLAHVEELFAGRPSGAAVAALVLDRSAGVRFRCDNPSIGGLGVFPYLVRYRRGRRIAGFAASGTSGLLAVLVTRTKPQEERAV